MKEILSFLDKVSPVMTIVAVLSIGINIGKGKVDFLDCFFLLLFLIVAAKETLDNFR